MTTPANTLYGDIFFLNIPSTTIPTGASTLKTAGYKTAGLGAATYKRVPAGPATNARAQSADGVWWELAETHVDPTMVGALANGYTFSDLQFKNSGDFTLATFVSGLYSFTNDHIGAPIQFWNPNSNSMFSTTISQINVNGDAKTVKLAAAPSTSPNTNADLQGELGTDDAVAINFAMSLCGWPNAFGGESGMYTPTAYQGSGPGWWNQGTRTLVFRSAGRFISRYCVSSPVRLLSGASVEWEDGAWLVALPNFSTTPGSNQAVLHQVLNPNGNGTVIDIVGCKLTNAQINAGGFADKCLWIEQGSENTIDRGAKLYGGMNRGLKLGSDSSPRLITTAVNGLVRVERGTGITSTTLFPVPTPTSAIGVEFTGYATDNYIDSLFCIGYYTGFADNGANNRVKDMHVWTGKSYMTTGVLLSGYAGKYGRIFIDTLYAPPGTAGTTTSIGVDITKGGNEIDSIASTVNTTYGTQDNTMTLIRPRQAGTSEVHIGSVYCTGAPSCKWLQVVDATAIGYPYLKIDDLTTDGNVYTIGYETPSQLDVDVSATGTRALAAFRSRIETLENAMAGALWNPIKIASEVQLWLDASSVDTLLLDGGLGVKSWTSRLGSGAAAQALQSLRPTFNPTGWDGTLPCVDFNGSSNALLLPQFFTNNLADFRIFFVWRRNTQNSQSNNHYLMVLSSQGDIAHGMNLATRVLSTSADSGQTMVQFGQPGSNTLLFQDAGAGTGTGGVDAGARALMSYGADAATINTSAANSVTIKGRLNGAASTQSAGSGTTSVIASNAASYLGEYSGGTNPVAMSLCELIILTGGLTTSTDSNSEDRKIEGYLAWKWWNKDTLPLPSDHSYYSSKPLFNS